MFKYEPGDIILYDTAGYSRLIRPIVRWLLGSEWGHVSIFYGYTKREMPLVIESIGRGVLMRTLLSSKGRKVKVVRWNGDDAAVGRLAAKAAERLADNPGSWYGYVDIPRYILPRLIWHKLTGRRTGFGYWHNNHFICSELVAQAYINAGFVLFTNDFIPLPGDFDDNSLLGEVWSGTL